MADYSPNEIVNMIMCVERAGGNYKEAECEYRRRFPDQRCPSQVTIESLVQRARGGHLTRNRKKKDFVDNDNPDERLVTILALVHLNPHVSLREIEKNGIPRSTAQRLLKVVKYHPYHISMHQALSNQDFIERLNFCNWARRKIEEDPRFFHRVMFSDEASFLNVGSVNR